MSSPHSLSSWTQPALKAQCDPAFNEYRAAKTTSYQTYFAANPDLKADDHAYKAGHLASALPIGWGADLETLLPPGARHRHHLSGNSSQTLALGLLGSAAKLDPQLDWLYEAFSPLPPAKDPPPAWRFEAEMPEALLGEQKPRVTSVDFFVEDPSAVFCVEAKWVEEGIGHCSCADTEHGDPATASCSSKVLNRPVYWETAEEVFGLPPRELGKPCPLSPVYQAVRNVAAALRLAGPDRIAVFGLVYDAENPYFAGCGDWPGWPTVLASALDDADPRLQFRSISWQALLPLLPEDESVQAWASEKHELH